MKNNILWIILSAIIVFFIFFYVLPYHHDKSHACLKEKEVYNQYIRSKVEKKFIDTPNHSFKKIIYLDDNRNENELVFTPEYKSMYDSLNIGDSIIKTSSTLYYKIKFKATGKEKIFKFHTLCKDSIK